MMTLPCFSYKVSSFFCIRILSDLSNVNFCLIRAVIFQLVDERPCEVTTVPILNSNFITHQYVSRFGSVNLSYLLFFDSMGHPCWANVTSDLTRKPYASPQLLRSIPVLVTSKLLPRTGIQLFYLDNVGKLSDKFLTQSLTGIYAVMSYISPYICLKWSWWFLG